MCVYMYGCKFMFYHLNILILYIIVLIILNSVVEGLLHNVFTTEFSFVYIFHYITLNKHL